MLNELRNITVYHGSYTIVEHANLDKTRRGKDFGKGFYLTTDKNQAIKFARLIARREGLKAGYISKYTISDFDGLAVFEFAGTDIDWLNCIAGNREKKFKKLAEQWSAYDVIVGKIADDDTSFVLNAYLNGAYGKVGTKSAVSTAVKMLIPERLKNQICLKTDKALEKLIFKEAEVTEFDK